MIHRDNRRKHTGKNRGVRGGGGRGFGGGGGVTRIFLLCREVNSVSFFQGPVS